MNLVGNALKFTHEGEVAVRLALAEPLQTVTAGLGVVLHFSVHDTGIGIPREQLAHIFEAFKQADGSTTRKYGGTGLGLTISSRLVEGLGGRLWVESEEGRGSTFHFTIRTGVVPLAARHAAQRARPAHLSQVGPRHLLLVDDNRVNQRLTVGLLERDGHTVTVVSSGEAAIAATEAAVFDAVLMDVQMPGTNGFDATAAIRARERRAGGHIPIIAMTAHAMQGDRERCLEAGMDGYLAKPVALATIREALADVLLPASVAS